jgi:hypothetical protein
MPGRDWSESTTSHKLACAAFPVVGDFEQVSPRLGLAARAGRRIFGSMSKPRVTFKMQRIAEDDWQILAEFPGAEPRYIKGLKSKAEVDEWLQGTRRIDWLRSQGYAK